MIIHTHEYDSEYHPAMPIMEFQIRRRASQPSITIKAIVDLDADTTMIPLRYLHQLQARKVRTKWMRGITGSRYEVDLYTLAVQVGNRSSRYLEVIGSERQDEVIVRRDLLNQYIVTLNAPTHIVEVST